LSILQLKWYGCIIFSKKELLERVRNQSHGKLFFFFFGYRRRKQSSSCAEKNIALITKAMKKYNSGEEIDQYW